MLDVPNSTVTALFSQGARLPHFSYFQYGTRSTPQGTPWLEHNGWMLRVLEGGDDGLGGLLALSDGCLSGAPTAVG